MKHNIIKTISIVLIFSFSLNQVSYAAGSSLLPLRKWKWYNCCLRPPAQKTLSFSVISSEAQKALNEYIEMLKQKINELQRSFSQTDIGDIVGNEDRSRAAQSLSHLVNNIIDKDPREEGLLSELALQSCNFYLNLIIEETKISSIPATIQEKSELESTRHIFYQIRWIIHSLQETQLCDFNNPKIRETAEAIVKKADARTDTERALAVSVAVREMAQEHPKFGYLDAKASEMLGKDVLYGNCINWTNLQVAMLRSLGIPARYVEAALDKRVYEQYAGTVIPREIYETAGAKDNDAIRHWFCEMFISAEARQQPRWYRFDVFRDTAIEKEQRDPETDRWQYPSRPFELDDIPLRRYAVLESSLAKKKSSIVAGERTQIIINALNIRLQDAARTLANCIHNSIEVSEVSRLQDYITRLQEEIKRLNRKLLLLRSDINPGEGGGMGPRDSAEKGHPKAVKMLTLPERLQKAGLIHDQFTLPPSVQQAFDEMDSDLQMRFGSALSALGVAKKALEKCGSNSATATSEAASLWIMLQVEAAKSGKDDNKKCAKRIECLAHTRAVIMAIRPLVKPVLDNIKTFLKTVEFPAVIFIPEEDVKVLVKNARNLFEIIKKKEAGGLEVKLINYERLDYILQFLLVNLPDGDTQRTELLEYIKEYLQVSPAEGTLHKILEKYAEDVANNAPQTPGATSTAKSMPQAITGIGGIDNTLVLMGTGRDIVFQQYLAALAVASDPVAQDRLDRVSRVKETQRVAQARKVAKYKTVQPVGPPAPKQPYADATRHSLPPLESHISVREVEGGFIRCWVGPDGWPHSLFIRQGLKVQSDLPDAQTLNTKAVGYINTFAQAA